jgi:hypothetical protein
MEVCFSAEMGALGASHLGTGDHGPKTDRIRPQSVPVNALVVTELSKFIDWLDPRHHKHLEGVHRQRFDGVDLLGNTHIG